MCSSDLKGGKAHAKGFLWFNRDIKSAIWVIHSLPHYNPNPKNDATWKIRDPQLKHGQMLFIAHLNGTANIRNVYRHITRLQCKLDNLSDGMTKLERKFGGSKSQISGIESTVVHVGRDSSCKMKIFLKASNIQEDIYLAWNVNGIVGTHRPGYKTQFDSRVPFTRCGGCEPGKLMPKKDIQRVIVKVAEKGRICWG